jgi:splicing factor 3B subunit 3
MYGMQSLEMQDQISCISIPSKKNRKKQPIPPISERIRFVIGTWAPSVEIWSVAPDGEFRKDAACTTISATSGVEISEKGLYTPHNVCFVYAGKYYVLAGLRNGMLLRFEWLPELPHSSPDSASSSINSSPELSHSSPDSASSSINLPTSTLQLIASRCIGNAHVFLVPLEDTLDADIIALSDRPWLLHTAGRGISCTSLSFQSPNNVTPVCTMDYPKGILFYADNRLHLVRELHYSMMLPHCFIPLFLWSLFLL